MDKPNCKPILFNTEMVRAILDGRKTMTRRTIKLQGNPQWSGYIPDGSVLYGSNNIPAAKSAYNAGDILWVRETWSFCLPENQFLYRADGDNPHGWYFEAWRPSIHMPKAAARIFLCVTDVRVERVQDITVHDAALEGCDGKCTCPSTGCDCSLSIAERDYSVEAFETLWDSTIKKADIPKYGWEANPWVWVYAFERVEKPEGWCE